jgi:hypothetical protein
MVKKEKGHYIIMAISEIRQVIIQFIVQRKLTLQKNAIHSTPHSLKAPKLTLKLQPTSPGKIITVPPLAKALLSLVTSKLRIV